MDNDDSGDACAGFVANLCGGYESSLADRPAVVYADFFLPHLPAEATVLDVGCGDGALTIGLADAAGRVTGVDVSPEAFEPAQEYVAARGISNVAFQQASAYELPFGEGAFDAVLAHSMLETLERPVSALQEMSRVLRPGGIVGVASVDYGGIILAGPQETLLRRFYAIREHLWQLGGDSPYRGRELRGLLNAAGFDAVSATTRAIPYGTDDAVRAFGRDRAEQARGGGFVEAALEHGLATAAELAAMAEGWLEWSEAPDAYFAFAWCRATGVKPEPAASR